MMRQSTAFGLFLLCGVTNALEVTILNDSLTNQSSGSVQSGFVAGEQGAAWLDAPCDGNIVATQVFWRSASGTTASSIEAQITISEAGTFPEPGAVLEAIVGPVMTDGVVNEFRFLDENNVIPLIVPVVEGETYVVSFTFENSPNQFTASLVSDADGCQAGRNGIYALLPPPVDDFVWFSSCDLGVSGDFVIRAVVDCPIDPSLVDLSITTESSNNTYVAGEDLSYTITASNSGPNTANSATIIDFFPASLNSINWTCVGSNGATCTNQSGNGNITESVTLPANSSLIYEAVGTVIVGTQGVISNTSQIVVPNGLNDSNPNNNSSTLEIDESVDDLIFVNGFELINRFR